MGQTKGKSGAGNKGSVNEPERTCVACREVFGKREMVRVVRTPQGSIVVDGTGKASGRGAYLCPTEACWKRGITAGQLERALHAKLDLPTKDSLMSFDFDRTKKEVSP